MITRSGSTKRSSSDAFSVFGMGFDDRLKRGKDLGNSLDEFGLVRVLLLDKLDDGLDVTHVTS